METKCNVTEIEALRHVDRWSRSLVVRRRFNVQREGGEKHVVTVEASESGTPQNETCDCKGFKFKGECSHIKAVYEAGVLSVEW